MAKLPYADEFLFAYIQKRIKEFHKALLLKQTDTSKRLLADCNLEYPYEGSKTLMYAVEEIENIDFIKELLYGMYNELPEPKKEKNPCD